MMSVRPVIGRPIGDQPRLAFAIAALVLLLAAGGLALSGGTQREPSLPTSDPHAANPAAGPVPTIASPVADGTTTDGQNLAVGVRGNHGGPAVKHAAQEFLAGYLPYLYGQASPGSIERASVALRRRLSATPPRVSPATRKRRPRVVRLTVKRLASGRWHAVATVDDGGVARYPVELLVSTSPRGRVVTSVVSE